MNSMHARPLKPLNRDLAGEAAEKWAAFARSAEAADCAPPDGRDRIREAQSVFAFSDFIAKAASRHPAMMVELMESGDLEAPYPSERHGTIVRQALDTVCKAPDRTDLPALQKVLRTVRRREMIRIAYRDLAGRADLGETMTELSRFADACLIHTLDCLHRHRCTLNGTPVGKSGHPQQLVILAMGKLGAGELNFSSDIDLIFTYPEAGETRGGSSVIGNDDFFTRLCRDLIRVIGGNTADGTVFRIDLGLRPFGESGPMVLNFDAMEDYYQSQGREWERYAWIKARVAAGDRSAGSTLLDRLKPFVYRRYLDFGVFESLREMKQMISRDVLRKRMAGNIKLGAGGIREIEFFGQIFQLIRGGVVPSLQKRGIQTVLNTLAEEHLIPGNVRDELLSAYAFLRRTEHRLQEFSDQQTHDLPVQTHQRNRLAGSLGFDRWDLCDERLKAHMGTVHRHFQTLLAPDKSSKIPDEHHDLDKIWQGTADPETGHALLAKMGFDSTGAVMPLVENLRDAAATRAMSAEGRKRLDSLMPSVLTAAGKAEHPLPVLKSLVELIKTIGQRISYLALLLENPAVLSHLVTFADASPWITTFMARHPVLLDELLDARTLFIPPGKGELKNEIRKRLDRIPTDDLELLIEELCIFKQVSILRVAAADVAGHLPLMKVSDHLSWIAETILDRVLAVAWRELAVKHGLPESVAGGKPGKGRGFAVIAYGKLGGLELSYDSDLDLVFLHAGGSGMTRGGPMPIDTPQFFARLGQRVVHILTSHTPAGRLYETDMRLRPSGSSGPLVSQIEAFREYQLHDAWTWESQAIVRARAICGDTGLGRRFEQIRREVLARTRDRDALRKEVSDMRERLRQESIRPESGMFHLKQGRGAMVDIEFVAQYLVLLGSHAHPELGRWSDNVRILESLTDTGVIDNETAFLLKRAYLTYRAAAHRLSLREKPPEVSREKFRALRDGVIRIWDGIFGSCVLN